MTFVGNVVCYSGKNTHLCSQQIRISCGSEQRCFFRTGESLKIESLCKCFVVFFFTLFPTIMEFKWKKILLETSHSSSVWPHFPLSHDSLVGRAIQMNHPEIQQRFPWISTPLLRQTNTLVCIRVMWSFSINRFLGPEEGDRKGNGRWDKKRRRDFQRFHKIDSIFTMELCDLNYL